MTLGAENLLGKHNGSRIAVAEAYIMGQISNYDERFVEELISRITVEVARIRLEAKGLLNKEGLSASTKKQLPRS